jgi:hypothetical protein
LRLAPQPAHWSHGRDRGLAGPFHPYGDELRDGRRRRAGQPANPLILAIDFSRSVALAIGFPAPFATDLRNLMKDQYVGDINDFYKYALLRTLSADHPGRLAVCWMLTSPDGRRDGGQLSYLARSARFRPVDTELFDAMRSLVHEDSRSVAAVANAAVLPGARYITAVVPDEPAGRKSYFAEVWELLRYDDLVFFDPDNGLEVASVPKHRRGASRYLYWDEFAVAACEGRSVCVYQHFPRVPRASFTLRLLSHMARLAPAHRAFALITPRVAFLVAAAPQRAESMARAGQRLADRCEDIELLSVESPTGSRTRSPTQQK